MKKIVISFLFILLLSILFMVLDVDTFYAEGTVYPTVDKEVFALKKGNALQTFVMIREYNGKAYVGPTPILGEYGRTLRIEFIWQHNKILFHLLEFYW